MQDILDFLAGLDLFKDLPNSQLRAMGTMLNL